RVWGVLIVSGVLLGACGGGDDTPAGSPTSTVAEAGQPPAAGGTVTVAGDASPTTQVVAPSGGEFDPGDVSYRVVNLLDEPVDLYARTQGFVEAFPLELGVAPGAVTEFYAPPADGRFL